MNLAINSKKRGFGAVRDDTFLPRIYWKNVKVDEFGDNKQKSFHCESGDFRRCQIM